MDQSFWNFVEANRDADPSALRLKYHGNTTSGIDLPLAIVQIECRKKFRKKLAETLAAHPHFIFPSVLAGEQSTSDLFASYHNSLCDPASSIVDLTAGLGIDMMHFASCTGRRIVGVELDADRVSALRVNFSDIPSVTIFEGDCRDYLAGCTDGDFDVAFIDPARRSDDGSRVFALGDCRPDVTAMLSQIKRVARRLIVKMSPMFDMTAAASQLTPVVKMIAVGTPTECRELIAVVDFSAVGAAPVIEALTLTPTSQTIFAFTRDEEANASVTFGTPSAGDIVCEPYPALLKAGAFRLFAERYNLSTLSANSHVYFGREVEPSIPAVRYEVVQVLPYASSVIKRLKRRWPVATIACRNFDVSPDVLRRKLGIADGGNIRIIATKDSSAAPMLIVVRSL